MSDEKPVVTLNMCDFCSYERRGCGASPVLAEKLKLEKQEPRQLSAVIACDKYKSPVDVFKERFHDPSL